MVFIVAADANDLRRMNGREQLGFVYRDAVGRDRIRHDRTPGVARARRGPEQGRDHVTFFGGLHQAVVHAVRQLKAAVFHSRALMYPKTERTTSSPLWSSGTVGEPGCQSGEEVVRSVLGYIRALE